MLTAGILEYLEGFNLAQELSEVCDGISVTEKMMVKQPLYVKQQLVVEKIILIVLPLYLVQVLAEAL